MSEPPSKILVTVGGPDWSCSCRDFIRNKVCEHLVPLMGEPVKSVYPSSTSLTCDIPIFANPPVIVTVSLFEADESGFRELFWYNTVGYLHEPTWTDVRNALVPALIQTCSSAVCPVCVDRGTTRGFDLSKPDDVKALIYRGLHIRNKGACEPHDDGDLVPKVQQNKFEFTNRPPRVGKRVSSYTAHSPTPRSPQPTYTSPVFRP